MLISFKHSPVNIGYQLMMIGDTIKVAILFVLLRINSGNAKVSTCQTLSPIHRIHCD